MLACLAGICQPALAQWATDPSQTLVVADGNSEQVQPKLAITSDGKIFISWFDNSIGGYDVRLQLLNADGVEQWPHNGILLADRGVSSTIDYALAVDSQGNALITYTDDGGTGGTQQVVAQKIAQNRTILWTSRLTNDSNSKGNPSLAVLSDDSVVVGYSTNNTIPLMRLSAAAGTPLWASPLILSEASRYMSLADLKGTTGGNFVASWVRGTTSNFITSTKAIYSQKFDSSGAPLWGSSPLIIFNTTSIQNGYFPTIEHDGAGGAVYGWYEIGGSRNSYVQHVLSNGTRRFASPVASTGVTTGRIRTSASVAYDNVSDQYFIASSDTNSSTQSNFRTLVQKIDNTGTRQWGNDGVVLIDVNNNQPSFVTTQKRAGGGCYVASIDARSATTGIIFGAGVNDEGTTIWSEQVCSIVATKSRLTSKILPNGNFVVAFGNLPFGQVDILAQMVQPDGTIGGSPRPPACPADMNTDGTVDGTDFVLFINSFALGDATIDALADINHDGTIDGNDFVAFINDFALGC